MKLFKVSRNDGSRTVKCVFANDNEWTQKWDTFVGIYSEVKDTIDLDKQTALLVSNDNWQSYFVNYYSVSEVIIPKWLWDGFIARGKYAGYTETDRELLDDCLKVLCDCAYTSEVLHTIRKLAVEGMTGGFSDSLRNFWSAKGYLSPKQCGAILYPKWNRRAS